MDNEPRQKLMTEKAFPGQKRVSVDKTRGELLQPVIQCRPRVVTSKVNGSKKMSLSSRQIRPRTAGKMFNFILKLNMCYWGKWCLFFFFVFLMLV